MIQRIFPQKYLEDICENVKLTSHEYNNNNNNISLIQVWQTHTSYKRTSLCNLV